MCSVSPERHTEGESAEGSEEGGNGDECLMKASRGKGVENAERSGWRSVVAR